MRDNFAKNRNSSFILSVILVLIALFLGLLVGKLPLKFAFGVAGGIAVFALILLAPVWIVVPLVAVCPFGKLWETEGTSIYELAYAGCFLFLLMFTLVKMFFRTFAAETEKESLHTPVTRPLLCLFLFSAISAIVAVNLGNSFGAWSSDLNIILFYGMYFIVLYNFKSVRPAVKIYMMVATATILGLLFFRQSVARGGADVLRFGTAAASAYNVAAFLPMISLAMFYRGSFIKRMIYLGMALILVAGVLFTFGRSRWLGLIAGMMFLFWFIPGFVKFRVVKLAYGMLIFLLLYFLFCITFPIDHVLTRMPELLMSRVASSTKIQSEAPIKTRFSESAAAYEKVKNRPIMGNGLGTAFTYVRYDEGPPHPVTLRYLHNSYLFLWLNTGLLGLLSFLWMCLTFLIYGIKVMKRLPDGYHKALTAGFVSSFIAVLVSSLTAPDMTSPIFSIYVGFMMGAVALIDVKIARPAEMAGAGK